MAVYEMNRKAIAEYLSSTRNEFILGCSVSNEGKRVNRAGNTYPIQVIDLKAEGVIPNVDCFLNTDDSISVRVYLPGYTYFAVTKELHKAYGGNSSLRFSFICEPRSFEYTLPNGEVTSYKDFKEPMGDLIRRISEEMKQDINCFKTHEEWKFKGIQLDTVFKTYSMK